jgi:hypothetical protein
MLFSDAGIFAAKFFDQREFSPLPPNPAHLTLAALELRRIAALISSNAVAHLPPDEKILTKITSSSMKLIHMGHSETAEVRVKFGNKACREFVRRSLWDPEPVPPPPLPKLITTKARPSSNLDDVLPSNDIARELLAVQVAWFGRVKGKAARQRRLLLAMYVRASERAKRARGRCAPAVEAGASEAGTKEVPVCSGSGSPEGLEGATCGKKRATSLGVGGGHLWEEAGYFARGWRGETPRPSSPLASLARRRCPSAAEAGARSVCGGSGSPKGLAGATCGRSGLLRSGGSLGVTPSTLATLCRTCLLTPLNPLLVPLASLRWRRYDGVSSRLADGEKAASTSHFRLLTYEHCAYTLLGAVCAELEPDVEKVFNKLFDDESGILRLSNADAVDGVRYNLLRAKICACLAVVRGAPPRCLEILAACISSAAALLTKANEIDLGFAGLLNSPSPSASPAENTEALAIVCALAANVVSSFSLPSVDAQQMFELLYPPLQLAFISLARAVSPEKAASVAFSCCCSCLRAITRTCMEKLPKKETAAPVETAADLDDSWVDFDQDEFVRQQRIREMEGVPKMLDLMRNLVVNSKPSSVFAVHKNNQHKISSTGSSLISNNVAPVIACLVQLIGLGIKGAVTYVRAQAGASASGCERKLVRAQAGASEASASGCERSDRKRARAKRAQAGASEASTAQRARRMRGRLRQVRARSASTAQRAQLSVREGRVSVCGRRGLAQRAQLSVREGCVSVCGRRGLAQRAQLSVREG